MIDGQNDTIVIGLQACAPVFATGSIDDAAEAGEEGSCCNGFQVDWLSEDVRRLLAAHGFTAPDPVDSVARRMVEREVLTPGIALQAVDVFAGLAVRRSARAVLGRCGAPCAGALRSA